MDYEKKYKEALEKAQRFYNNSVAITKKGLEDIFPELKESEDEEIKEMLKVAVERTPWMQDKKEKCYEWLEKQGEQNPVVVIPKFRVGDVIRLKGSTAEYTIESISGECYHGKGWGLHIGYEEDYELVEQNPSWSEEDEQMYIEIIYILAGFRGNEVKLDWLKSIKDRIQPKQEWSENEKDRLNKISKYLRCKGYEDDACWLKSLIPQHTWKPSDEQINALEGIKDYVALTSGYWGQTMTEIIKQLKQL